MNPTSTASPNAEAPPIDRPSLVNRCMGDASFAGLILGKFQARANEMVVAIEKAIAAGDIVGAGRAAHALKGAAANLSAEAVRAHAQTIEQAGHDGNLAAAQAAIGQLRQAMDCCLAYIPTLTAELQRMPAAAA